MDMAVGVCRDEPFVSVGQSIVAGPALRAAVVMAPALILAPIAVMVAV